MYIRSVQTLTFEPKPGVRRHVRIRAVSRSDVGDDGGPFLLISTAKDDGRFGQAIKFRPNDANRLADQIAAAADALRR